MFDVVIRHRVNGILDDLQMTGWYRQIVTDCGSNAKSAFKRDHVWDWMRCACHLLHNVVEAGFKTTQRSEDDPSWAARSQCLRALAKAKAFVAHIHHSRKASERFNEKQRMVLVELRHREASQAAARADDGSDSEETMEAVELQPGVPGFDPCNVPNPKRVYRLTSQVDTRWNSRCYMMERWVHTLSYVSLPYVTSFNEYVDNKYACLAEGCCSSVRPCRDTWMTTRTPTIHGCWGLRIGT